MIAVLVALCAGLVGWWLVPAPGAATRLRAAEATGAGRVRGGASERGTAADARGARGRRGARRSWLVVAVAGGAVVGAGVVAGPGAAAVALALAQVCGCAAGLARARLARRARARRRAEVVHAGELIAGLLRVGRVAGDALGEAASDAPVLARAATEVAVGGEATSALRHAVVLPGHEGLDDLAAAWELSVRTGASLAPALDAAAARLASDHEIARVVETELAAARLAGRMLAVLPVVGLGLSFLLGGDPFGFLTGGVIGWVCLNLGAGLACAGVLWIEAVAAKAGGS